MFKRVQNIIFRVSRVLALIVVSQSALAFDLSTKDLLNKKDHFSLLKKSEKYAGLNLFLETCFLKTVKDCVLDGKKVYENPKYQSFKYLVAQKIIERIAGTKLSLSELSFINPWGLQKSDLKRVLERFSAEEVVAFMGEAQFEVVNSVGRLLLEKPNLICKFKNHKEITQPILAKVSEDFSFYNKDFSSFPCGLELDVQFDGLLSEIKVSKTQSKFKKDFQYSFLRKKVSREAYRKFPRYRKLSKEKRHRLQWKIIKEHLPYIQNRIVKNLFYAGKYEMLGAYNQLSEDKKPTLQPESLVYVVKSLASLQKGAELLSISEDLDWQKARWSEEILLMRAATHLRKNDFVSARLDLEKLVEKSENLKLSGLYWTWVSYKKENKLKKMKAIAKDLLKFYPFTYYGLRVAKDLYGVDFFERYTKNNTFKQSFSSSLSGEERERLEYFYAYERKHDFKKTYFEIKSKLNPKQKSLMSLVFANLDHQIEVIRSLNKIWDEEQGLRATPFVNSSFPLTYKEVSTEVSQKLKWVSPSLIHAVIRQESAFNERARSTANAMGLMQLLPSTAKEVARRSKNKKYRRRKDLFKPEVNIALGANYLNRLINASKGYLPYAFASYNAGPGRMYKWSKTRQDVKALRQGLKEKSFDPLDDLWLEELPWSETRFYTKALLRNTGIYLALMNDKEALKCAPFWRCHRSSL